MEKNDSKTNPKKDVINVDADETTLPHGFDDPLLDRFVDPIKFSTIKKCKTVFFKFCVNSPDAEKSFCIEINYLGKSCFALSLGY